MRSMNKLNGELKGKYSEQNCNEGIKLLEEFGGCNEI